MFVGRSHIHLLLMLKMRKKGDVIFTTDVDDEYTPVDWFSYHAIPIILYMQDNFLSGRISFFLFNSGTQRESF